MVHPVSLTTLTKQPPEWPAVASPARICDIRKSAGVSGVFGNFTGCHGSMKGLGRLWGGGVGEVCGV